MTAMFYFSLFSFVSQNLTNYGRRHLKLFTNCHVSWDTLYVHLWEVLQMYMKEILSGFFTNISFLLLLDNVLHVSSIQGDSRNTRIGWRICFLKEQRIRVDIYSYWGTWGLQNHYIHLLKWVDRRNFKCPIIQKVHV